MIRRQVHNHVHAQSDASSAAISSVGPRGQGVGLGLWASLLLDPTVLIGLFVGLGAALFFFLVLGALLDPWLTRRIQREQR